MLSDWRGAVARIGEGLELAWPRHPDNAAGDIEEFLSGELRHFRAASENMPQHSLAFAWVARAYAVFERWAADGEQAADYAELDAVKAAFDEASPLLGMITRETRGLQAKLSKAETALAAARAESIGHEANHTIEQRNRGVAEARVAELEVELEGARKSRMEVESDLAQMRSAFLQRGHELDELREQTERDQGSIARMSGELDAVRDELERLENRHERDARHLAQMARQLAPLIRQEFGAVLDSKRAEETVARLEREKAELAVVKTSLETRLSVLSEEMARERVAAASQVSSLKAERDDLKSLEQKVEVAQKAVEQKVAELEAFRQAVANSTSWRLTAPLRGISRLLKGR